MAAPPVRVGEALSRRELEVAELLGRGLSNTDIGARLFISPKTVEHHVGHVLAKKHRAAMEAYVTRSSLSSGRARAAK
ncbi:MAG TPA: helix-turn-helix transcriptional regulator [Polyangia bacterium]|nr:helix-turn-helix transcriptional regulator [Polyangia bacterium]